VVEEARHMRYAREETLRQIRELGPIERVASQLVLGVVAALSTGRLVHPRVYAAVGLDVREAAATARANPAWVATRQDAARKAVAFFTQAGLISPVSRPFWRSARLIG
jgi:hypothetical protein